MNHGVRRDLTYAVIAGIGDVDVARGIDCDAGRTSSEGPKLRDLRLRRALQFPSHDSVDHSSGVHFADAIVSSIRNAIRRKEWIVSLETYGLLCR
jgi:hypothetical protein